MKSMRTFVLFISSFVLLCSCSKNELEDFKREVGKEYFPSQLGSTWIYDIDSIVFDDFTNRSDTFHYQVREFYESLLTDNAGRPTMRIERSFRQNDTSSWVISRIWTSNLTETTFEKTEENQKFVRLIFPIIKNKTWNGNQFNNLEEEDYKYTQIHAPNTVAGVTYDSTVRVLQNDISNFIQEKFAEEIYAKNVGLVYKISTDIETQNHKPKGLKFIQKLRTYIK